MQHSISLMTNLPLHIKLLISLLFLPQVIADSTQPFPNITFSTFSTFIQQTFNPHVSLATVLMMLFTMTDNTDLLNLHARQQHPEYQGEKHTAATGWIRALSRAVKHKMDNDTRDLFANGQCPSEEYQEITQLSLKLDRFATFLRLTPYTETGTFTKKLQPVSYQEIQSVHVICPPSIYCMNANCDPRALHQTTRTRDIPLVTLVKNNIVYKDVPVLTGKCSTCSTTYHGDHEKFKDQFGIWNRSYLNSARYLKVGQNVWVDRIFSNVVLNGMYKFHASASAYTQFWNDAASSQDLDFQLSRRQVWQAFIQESVRVIAKSNKTELEIHDSLSISEVTKEAFRVLGKQGILEVGLNHSCGECTQPYKATADLIANDDPAAVAGNDERHNVPPLEGTYAAQSAAETTEARQQARRRRLARRTNNAMNVVYAPVKMVILDGIVMGPMVMSLNI